MDDKGFFMRLLEDVGLAVAHFVEEMGRIMVFFTETLLWLFRPPLNLRNIFKQMEEIGVNSVGVVIIMASFTGMVLALQSYTGFKRFNAESLVGTVVALSMTRELGPVLTGLIVAGRAGASMAAELGTMRVTEQIDALATMATNPIKYLTVPRVIAGFIMLPLLTIISNMLGIFGGYLVGVKVLDANPVVYMRRSFDYLEMNDVFSSLFKTSVIGLIISVISCYKGFYAAGGEEGVGKATTGAVVISMMLILISDYFLTAILF